MKNAPTNPREMAQEACQALRNSNMTPREHFDFLVQQGIIDRNGRVLVGKLFGANGDHSAPAKAPSAAQPETKG
jgi:hypothetical protein